MKTNNAYFSVDPTRYSAVLPTAHPPPGENRAAFRLVDAERHHAGPGAPHAEVSLDSTVEIRDLHSDEVEAYTLVHPDHANIRHNRISTFTPIGKALFGRRVGDEVEVEAPGGAMRFRIERIGAPE